MRIWRQRGEHQQAIGRSRGGRTTKIHALTDAECRPVAFLLTGGQIADCTAGAVLLEQMPRSAILHGDKGYDSDAIRRQVEGKGAMPNIPPKANRHWKNCFSPVLYRSRNAIERMFCRLKDFRRIATRYDRLAINFLAAMPAGGLSPASCFRSAKLHDHRAFGQHRAVSSINALAQVEPQRMFIQFWPLERMLGV